MSTAVAAPTAPSARKYLTFYLGNEEYGIDLLQIQEIVGVLPITRVPNAPAHIAGVMNVRGRILPVMDPAVRLGLDAAGDSRKCVVFVRHRGTVVGLLVDQVHDVVGFSASDIVPVPDFGIAVNTNYLVGLARQDRRLTMLLDPDRLVAPDA